MVAKRPAQECTCERAAEENKVPGAACECGKRPADACKFCDASVDSLFIASCSFILDIYRHMREEPSVGTEGRRD